MKWIKWIFYLRAVAYDRMRLFKWIFRLWKILLENSTRRLLENSFCQWKMRILVLKKLRKLVGFQILSSNSSSQNVLFNLLPRLTFIKWKEDTFRPYSIDLIPVLRRISQRMLEEAFYYLLSVSESRKHERFLASLPTSQPITVKLEGKEDPVSISPQQLKRTRKAPLDTRRTACRCVYVFLIIPFSYFSTGTIFVRVKDAFVPLTTISREELRCVMTN